MQSSTISETRNINIAIWCLLAFLSAANPAAAQTTTRTMTGTITDFTGVPIASATVKAIDLQRGTAVATTTDANGSYTLDLPTNGGYRIEISKDGFQRGVWPEFSITASQTAEFNFEIKALTGATRTANLDDIVGPGSELRERSQLLQTNNGYIRTTISGDVIERLPL